MFLDLFFYKLVSLYQSLSFTIIICGPDLPYLDTVFFKETPKYFLSSSLYVFFLVSPVSSQSTVDEYDDRDDDQESVDYYCISVVSM